MFVDVGCLHVGSSLQSVQLRNAGQPVHVHFRPHSYVTFSFFKSTHIWFHISIKYISTLSVNTVSHCAYWPGQRGRSRRQPACTRTAAAQSRPPPPLWSSSAAAPAPAETDSASETCWKPTESLAATSFRSGWAINDKNIFWWKICHFIVFYLVINWISFIVQTMKWLTKNTTIHMKILTLPVSSVPPSWRLSSTLSNLQTETDTGVRLY